MNKLIKGIAIAAVALGVGSAAGVTSASAKRHYTTTPTSLRGHWYSVLNPKNQIIITKYTFRETHYGKTRIYMSGKKFHSGEPHSDLTVSHRNRYGYYIIGQYASDEWPYWKRTSIPFENVHHSYNFASLKMRGCLPNDVGQYDVAYYFHKNAIKIMK